MLYTISVVPSAAVTLHSILFSPTTSSEFPLITILASLSLLIAFTAILSTEPPTLVLYSVTSLEKAGSKVPGLISKLLKAALLAEPSAAFIVILDEPSLSASIDAILPSPS